MMGKYDAQANTLLAIVSLSLWLPAPLRVNDMHVCGIICVNSLLVYLTLNVGFKLKLFLWYIIILSFPILPFLSFISLLVIECFCSLVHVCIDAHFNEDLSVIVGHLGEHLLICRLLVHKPTEDKFHHR